MNRSHYSLIIIFIVLFLASSGQSIKCSYCGKQIESTYISFNGNYYHEECYKNYVQPKCISCGKPIDGKFIVHENRKYHEECYNKNVALQCSLCGDLINGTYTSDYWGNVYHSFHESSEARCDYCDRFISAHLTKGGSKYNDGRVVCNICERTSVKTFTTAESIFNNVRRAIETLGIKIEYKKINLKIVDQNELQSISFSKGGITDTRGFAEYTYWQLGDKLERKEFTVYILSGMPHKEFEVVAAHELTHVWQYINAKNNLDAQLREGTAEYVAYRYMNKYSDNESKFVMHKISSNKNNIYGEGFRKVKRIVDQNGLNFVLNHIRNSNTFPVGY